MMKKTINTTRYERKTISKGNTTKNYFVSKDNYRNFHAATLKHVLVFLLHFLFFLFRFSAEFSFPIFFSYFFLILFLFFSIRKFLSFHEAKIQRKILVSHSGLRGVISFGGRKGRIFIAIQDNIKSLDLFFALTTFYGY